MKQIIAIILIIFPLFAKASVPEAEISDSIFSRLTPKQVADSIITLAKEYTGTRYHFGAQGPSAFDCSGFTGFIFKQFGITLSRTSTAQASDGRAVEGPISQLQKGDIVVFSGRRNHSIGHVGIFIEMDPDNKSFSFIHAATGGGVKISHLREKYYKDRFLGARRILPDFCALCPDTVETVENDLHGQIIEVPKLELDSTFLMLLLSSDGKWVYVMPDGELQKPDSATYIVLNGDAWSQFQHSTMLIPSLQHPKKSTAGSSGQNSSYTQGAQYHTIREGNTLSAIAKKYGTTVSRLCQLNGITTKTTLRIGKRIRVK